MRPAPKDYSSFKLFRKDSHILDSMKKQRALEGVNIGGWLVVEKWLTPSLFRGTDAIDEYGLSQTDEGRERIVQHRAEFIREADFKWLAMHGVELLRIPFGYWLLANTTEYVGGIERLDWAMQMAEKYKLKVLLDVHGLPGSQNGKFHSGRAGAITWRRDESITICKKIAERYGDSPALWGIEVINEPKVSLRRYWQLLGYYRRTYRVLKSILPTHVYVVFSDGFHPWLLAGALLGRRVAMDIHWYAFGAHNTSRNALLARVRRRRMALSLLQKIHPVIVGEWNAVVARESWAGDKVSRRALALEHHQVQREIYEDALAQCYWTYKTETDGLWSYRYLQEKVLTEVEKSGKVG